ncbi:MAG: FkbM family methyltransferase [Acidobacteriota bacterium]
MAEASRAFQDLAATISGAVGRESALIRWARPFYEWLLERVTGGRGYLRCVNGLDFYYVDPKQRGYFPPVYEPPVYQFIRNRVKPGDVSLDIGAHVGVYALGMAKWSAPDGRVIAFEPNPIVREVLADHVRRNGLSSRIEIVPHAVSDVVGTSTFQAADREGFSRLSTPNPERPEVHSSLEVRTTTIDAFCNAAGITPDWIMMDIEGYEGSAILGGIETIRAGAGRLTLIVEMHPPLWEISGSSRAAMEEILAHAHLRAVPLSGQADPLGEMGVVLLETVS